MWDTVKRTNLTTRDLKEGEEAQLKGAENIFNKIIEESFPLSRTCLGKYKKTTEHQIH